MACQAPRLYLSVEEAIERTVCHHVCLAGCHLLTCQQLHGAQAVFIQVVGVDLVYGQRCVAVAAPTAAQIQFGEYSAYLIAPAEGQSGSIVLAVACVREAYLPEQRREERARRSQSVDAQGVVASVVVGPFCMTYKSRRQRVKIEVAHTVAAYNHGGTLLVKLVDNSLQRVFRRIEVIAVELHGKASAPLVVYGKVPASANAKVCALRHDVYQRSEPVALRGILLQQLRSVVGRMVVNDYDVERKTCFLRQRAVNGIAYCLFTVAHGYHN